MKRATLTRFLIDEQYKHQSVPSDLRLLIEVVSRAIKAISINVGKGALAGLLGEHAGAGGVGPLPIAEVGAGIGGPIFSQGKLPVHPYTLKVCIYITARVSCTGNCVIGGAVVLFFTS